MDNLNTNIIEQNRIYKKALTLAMEGLRSIKRYNDNRISGQTIKEVKKILNNK